jgi:monoterpene epsilon-lactone hydrolase
MRLIEQDRSDQRRAGPVTWCGVDAAGIPAEWVEAGPAFDGQSTFVYLIAGSGSHALEMQRPVAARIALETGARVLSVAGRRTPLDSEGVVVDNAVIAYRWLLDEGCDPALTGFIFDRVEGSLAQPVFEAARTVDLPLPSAGSLPFCVSVTLDA